MASSLLEDLRTARQAVEGFKVVLVTGGSGYIGSHTVLEILKAGCAVVVLDNLVNSHMESLTRLYHIAQTEIAQLEREDKQVPPLIFHQVDLCDRKNVARLFHFWQSDDRVELFNTPNFNVTEIGSTLKDRTFTMQNYQLKQSNQQSMLPEPATKTDGRVVAVVHFAALKAVGESVSKPLQYYRNNIGGLLNLLEAMNRFKVNRIVFSSSAVVYGTGKEANISEDAVQVGGKGTGAGLVTNPYGRSKWMAEEILNDFCIANPSFECIALRYFNPTGSHPSGLIGEDPKGIPNNIVPVILQTFQRRRSKVYVYGSNYDTADGTGVRDYIHVEDLARGHLAALRSLFIAADDRVIKALEAATLGDEAGDDTDEAAPLATNYRVYNLGTGHGYSVLDIINAFAIACGTKIPFAVGDARQGDLGTVTASTTKAATELGWAAEFDIQDMCRDVYTFASENPTGYERLRKLSVMAMHDPSVMRRFSVAAGFVPEKPDSQDIPAMMGNMLKLSENPNNFTNAVRRMSVLSPSLVEEMGLESFDGVGVPDSAPGAGAAPTLQGQWGLFGEVSWEAQEKARRASLWDQMERRDSGVGQPPAVRAA